MDALTDETGVELSALTISPRRNRSVSPEVASPVPARPSSRSVSAQQHGWQPGDPRPAPRGFESNSDLHERIREEMASYKEPERNQHHKLIVDPVEMIKRRSATPLATARAPGARSGTPPPGSRNRSSTPGASQRRHHHHVRNGDAAIDIEVAIEESPINTIPPSRSASTGTASRAPSHHYRATSPRTGSVSGMSRRSFSPSINARSGGAGGALETTDFQRDAQKKANGGVAFKYTAARETDYAKSLNYTDQMDLYYTGGGLADPIRLRSAANTTGASFKQTTPRFYVKPASTTEAPSRIPNSMVDEIRKKPNAGVGFAMSQSRCGGGRYGKDPIPVRGFTTVRSRQPVWLHDTEEMNRAKRNAEQYMAELTDRLVDEELAKLSELEEDADLLANLTADLRYEARKAKLLQQYITSGGTSVSETNPTVVDLRQRLAVRAFNKHFAMPPPEFPPPASRRENEARESLRRQKEEHAMQVQYIEDELAGLGYDEHKAAALVPRVLKKLGVTGFLSKVLDRR